MQETIALRDVQKTLSQQVKELQEKMHTRQTALEAEKINQESLACAGEKNETETLVTQLRDTIKMRQRELFLLKRNFNTKNNENSQLQKSIKRLEQENALLQSGLSGDTLELTQQIQALQAKNKDLKQRLFELERRNVSREVMNHHVLDELQSLSDRVSRINSIDSSTDTFTL